MKILIVSATSLEIKPLIQFLGDGKAMPNRVSRYRYRQFTVDVLVTGVGMVPTAVFTSMVLGKQTYDAVINAGICGSFNRQIAMGEVINIETDSFPETGAEDGEHFLSLIDLQLIDLDEFPYEGGKLINHSVFGSTLVNGLRKVSGVTVNTVHGNQKSIASFVAKHKADVESMEGAAFVFVCKMHKMRFLQIRSVSNYVEERVASKWDIPLAIHNLNDKLFEILNEQSFILKT